MSKMADSIGVGERIQRIGVLPVVQGACKLGEAVFAKLTIILCHRFSVSNKKRATNLFVISRPLKLKNLLVRFLV